MRKVELLIVDDNAATRYAMRRVLEHRGYGVHEAGTGNEGLAALLHCAVDAVILDVNLPDISGYEVARQLRQNPATALLPVVHVSAASIATNDIITGLDAGADAYLIHPVDPDVLAATVRTLLRVRDAESALRASEERFREIFAYVAAPIGVIDAQLHVLESNAAFARLLPDCARMARLNECLAPSQQPAVEALRRCLDHGERWHGTLHLEAGRGLRETEWRVVPHGTPGQGLVFVDDVTERRRLEREQRDQLALANTQLAKEVASHADTEAQLRQAQKMDALGRLTGGIAHDFNNLLTGIITGIDLINRRVEEGRLDIQRYSDIAMQSARRAAALTHRLLAFARQQPLDARQIDINESIRSLKDLLRRTIGEDVALHFDLWPQPAVARIDASQLENAVLNLVINARDALAAGGQIWVSTRLEHVCGDAELDEGRYIALSVRDDGSGIPRDVLGQVFEPFFTTKPQGQGTGLGLSMIYGFARQSGGEARIQSTVGLGTTVTLLVPVAAGEAAAPLPTPAPDIQGRGEHLLLVEDSMPVRELVGELLHEAGYRCTVATGIDIALKWLRGDEAIDLLVTDVGMPGMDGRRLADMARGWRPHLPVLFVTGYAANAVAREEFLGPGMDMLAKPFETHQLLQQVRTMLDA